MPVSLHIELCRTSREWRLFERLPEILHGNDPTFVPPMPGQVMKLRSPRHPFHRDGSINAYIGFLGKEPVGRIASVVNRTHNAFHGDRTGFFGFFDFTDAKVAAALLAQARADARAEGLDVVRGPVSPTQNDECGLQVEGFGERPFFMMPYNPPYYVQVYEELGLKGVQDLYALFADAENLAAFVEGSAPAGERFRRRRFAQVRPLDLARLDDEVRMVSRLFNDIFAEEWSFMPMSAATVADFAKDLLRHVDSEAILVVELEGRPIGMSIAFPDLNEFLADAGRFPRALRWLRFAWLVKTSRCRRIRLAVFGMLPEHRAGAALLHYETMKRRAGSYTSAEFSWTQVQNEEVNRFLLRFGLQVYKRYRVYQIAT